MQPTDVRVHELMDVAAELIQTSADAAGIAVDFDHGGLTAFADPDAMVRVLTNLVNNAIKYSPRGSHITVRADSLGGGQVRLSVADNGRGIPADRLAIIFEPFVQVESSDAHERGGAGLGLAICRAIVQHHGGKIWAESSGRGSTFYVTLPARAA